MHIQVCINEAGALRNQRYAFTDRFTLISELLQNARRSGATRIDVAHVPDSKFLRVTDDGHGIEDFQKLLTFNESGWDASTIGEERPFGIGFSKCLYAATRCVVASSGQRVDFETESALAKALIEVEVIDGAQIAGTTIELHGVDLPGLDAHMGTLCQGFPVPVSFNGRLLQRSFTLAELATVPTSIGAVHLAGIRDGKHTSALLVFLQGFCVLHTGFRSSDDGNVIHLDSREFTARLPDRDKLIDEDQQRQRITAELKSCWRRVLEAAKAELPVEQFVETYYSAMRCWGHLDLLNDIDILPNALCEQIVGYPIQEGHDHPGYLAPMTAAPTRADIESGLVCLVAVDAMDEDSASRWMWARAKGHIVFDWIGLHCNHWARRHVRFLGEEAVTVHVESEQNRTELEGRWIWPTVILCEAVCVSLSAETVEVADAGVYHEGCLYIPVGETSGEPVRQASSFIDGNEQFLESDLDADRSALADLIARLRSVDPVQTLDSLLQTLGLQKYPLLHGKRFELTVGSGGAPGHSVQLLDDTSEGVGHAER
nr:ATP-binding protein [uncultured Roseateles sp.]